VVEIKRKKGESFEAFFRRFVRQLQRSGRMRQARKVRFLTREKSRTEARKNALVRAGKREQMEYLRKVGRLTEEDEKRSAKGGGRSR
jgi:ribosomal protein S21